jgi:peptidoglycan hydrolase CwlO-like protein
MLDNINFKREPLLGESSKEVWFSSTKILYLIIFLLLVIIVGGWFKYQSTDTSLFEDRLKKSELKIDSLSNENSGLKLQVIDLNKDIHILNGKLNTNSKEINNLKKDIDEKIKNVDTYSYDQLLLFFSNRYNESNLPN